MFPNYSNRNIYFFSISNNFYVKNGRVGRKTLFETIISVNITESYNNSSRVNGINF